MCNRLCGFSQSAVTNLNRHEASEVKVQTRSPGPGERPRNQTKQWVSGRKYNITACESSTMTGKARAA